MKACSRLFLAACVLSGSPALLRAQVLDWNQVRGNAAHTATSSFAPVTRAPVVAWRQDFEQLLSEPVLSGGVTFVVAMKDKRQTLLAYRTATGEPLGTKRLGRDAVRVHLAVWQGTVAVVTRDTVRTFQHRKTKFQDRHRIKGDWPSAPAVHEGHLFLAGSGLTCIDLAKGRVVVEGARGHGIPAVISTGEHSATVAVVDAGARAGYQGTWLLVHEYQLTGLGEKKLALSPPDTIYGGTFQGSGKTVNLSNVAPVRFEGANYAEGWFVRTPTGIRAQDGDAPKGLLKLSGQDAKLCPLAHPVAVRAGVLYGIAETDRVIQMVEDGGYYDLSDPPPGAIVGEATLAGDVLFFRNWAVEVASKRVLWCDPALQPVTPAIPAADGLLIVGFEDGLAGLADPSAVAAPGAESAAPAARALRPDSGDGVVASDGTWRPAGSDVPPGEVALEVAGGEVRVRGEQHPVFRAWRAALEGELVDSLEPLFAQYERSKFLEDGRRIIALALDHGLSEERAEAWNARLVGRSENRSANAPAQRERIAADEAQVLERAVQSFAEAADWCAANGLTVAATVLLAEADALVPGRSEVRERAARWVPGEFPWRGEDDAAARWMAWAVEILPAGAAFVSPDDEGWLGLVAPWNANTLWLRTRNLDFLSRAHDPAVVGGCLRSGEGAVRAAALVLGPGPRDRGARPVERLRVRLHKDRDDYLAEHVPGSGYAMPWSAGYYAPLERVSRFFVPPASEHGDPLGRGLYKTLAHEITHHYVDQRWMGDSAGPGPGTHGYWVVEGIARFLEDQVIEMGRLGTSFEDATVRSLDATARAHEKELLIPMATFVDMRQAGFAELGDTRVGEVELRHALVRLRVTQRNVFYEQAGSLVFFLVNRRGDEGRAALLRYLQVYYMRQTEDESWKLLGFDSAAELEQAFSSFLLELR